MVLKLLRENKLYAKRSKCEFGLQKIEYPGKRIDTDGVATDPSKIEAMKSWPVPKMVKEQGGFFRANGLPQKRNF